MNSLIIVSLLFISASTLASCSTRVMRHKKRYSVHNPVMDSALKTKPTLSSQAVQDLSSWQSLPILMSQLNLEWEHATIPSTSSCSHLPLPSQEVGPAEEPTQATPTIKPRRPPTKPHPYRRTGKNIHARTEDESEEFMSLRAIRGSLRKVQTQDNESMPELESIHA